MRVLAASLISTSGGPIGEEGSNRRGPTSFSVQLLLEHLPDSSEYRYRTLNRNGLTYYAGVSDHVARFFCHNPGDEKGYGGRIFTGLLEDETPFSVRGPWSSGPSEINSLGLFPDNPLVEASATDNREVFDRGYTFYALSGVDMDIIHQAELLLPGWTYHHNSSYTRHPSSYGASEEQTRAIEHPSYPLSSGWRYKSEFLPCPTCDGKSFTDASPNEKGAWKSERTGKWTKICPTCGHGCDSGVSPVPGMRWRGRLI